METAVLVVIGLVVLVFVFLLGALGRSAEGASDADVDRLAGELEAERQHVRELRAEVERLRGAQSSETSRV